MFPSGVIDYLTKHGKAPFELLVRGIQKIPGTMKAIAIAIGCCPELEGKTLLLRFYSLQKGLEGIKLELTWRPLLEG